ncbi:MAG TPA: MXAN_5187 C-terminal domain-containing protein, partial [Kofleriaceae bacterium]|nr:MXAN_5187 C-terminal domain-containing protein [Kofleriaceae bacterium]
RLDGAERANQAKLAFERFSAKETRDRTADIIALVDEGGNVIAMSDVATVVARLWKNDKGELIWPSVALALQQRIIISDVWDYQDKGMMRVGVASVVDPEAPDAKPVGAVVVAYSQTAREAQRQASMFGAQVAYYNDSRVFATSFQRSASEEDTAKRSAISAQMKSVGAVAGKPARIAIDGTDYVVATAKIQIAASRSLPAELENAKFSAAVIAPMTDAGGMSDIKKYIVFVGLGSLAIAMLGLYLMHRRLIAQVDQLELGVTDIINGNVDRTFRPVGLELDGLANGLNVMLSRLLGRPEPGEEELDDDGNPIVQGRVEFEDADTAKSGAADPELAALAQEPEPDYYKRLYTEYLAARRGINQPDEVSFETFITKLKVNEGKLRAQYQCKVVRFRVVTKDGRGHG